MTFFLHLRHIFLRPGGHFSKTKNDPLVFFDGGRYFIYGGSQFSTGIIFSTCRTRKKWTPVTFFLHIRHIFLRPGGHFSKTKNDP